MLALPRKAHTHMAFDTACPNCGSVYHADDAHAGMRVRCTRCGVLITLLWQTTSVGRPSGVRVDVPAAPSGRNRKPIKRNPERKSWLKPALIAGALLTTALSAFWLGRSTTSLQSDASTSVQLPNETSKRDSVASPAPPQDSNVVEEIPIPANFYEPRARKESPKERLCLHEFMTTGVRIEPDAEEAGHGVFTIENGTAQDAVVRVFDTSPDRRTIRWVFVAAHDSAQLTKIPDGTFGVEFASGLNWQQEKLEFCANTTYEEFSRYLVFVENRESDGIQFSRISLTLQPVKDGNVHTKGISREEFLRGVHTNAPAP